MDPHGVEAFAAAKLGSPEVYKAPVMPDEEKDSFESAFDAQSTFQLTGSAMNRRALGKDDDDDAPPPSPPPPCGAGTYSGSGRSPCTVCAAGTFQQYTGRYSCTNCAAGKFQQSTGRSSCTTKCAAGKYSKRGASFCTTCAAGTYSEPGQSLCSPCAAGKYSQPISTKIAVSGGCASWLRGTYAKQGSTASGAPYYKKGPYSWLYWDPNCGSDSGGTARWIFDNSEPSRTAASDLDGSGVCKYSAKFDSTDSKSPPWGRFTWFVACNSVSSNFAVWRNSYLTLVEKNEAGVESTHLERGQGDCEPCAPGKYSEPESSVCTDCDAGKYSKGGNGDGALEKGQGECEPCASGTFSGARASSCLDCAQGRWSKRGEESTKSCNFCEGCAAGTTRGG